VILLQLLIGHSGEKRCKKMKNAKGCFFNIETVGRVGRFFRAISPIRFHKKISQNQFPKNQKFHKTNFTKKSHQFHQLGIRFERVFVRK